MEKELEKLFKEFHKEMVGKEGLNPGDYKNIITYQGFFKWLFEKIRTDKVSPLKR